MTVVEGTAGNTGIGLALVAKAFGLNMLAVMPRGQTPEKERMITLYGAKLHLVDAVPFKDERHFYHTASRLAEADPSQFFWANQFENLANFQAHYTTTGPEIWQQMDGKVDALVSAAGTGGTIAGCSRYLKEKNPALKAVLADPEGSGLSQFMKTGQFKSEGSSFTEGIGIMRLVANFKEAQLDDGFTVTDRELTTIARYVRDQDGIVLGSSSALNLAGALRTAVQMGQGKRIVSFACDLGERSYSKLWNDAFLSQQNIQVDQLSIEALLEEYRKII